MGLSIIYGIVALLSALLLVGYLLFGKKKNPLFVGLFGCVALANCGFFLLSVSQTLVMAELANCLSYFGGAFSMLLMLLIVYDTCHMRSRPWMRWGFTCISVVVFLLTASGDWMGLYYHDLSLQTVNGLTQLVKVYGPLHCVYTIYLCMYLLVMLLIIGHAMLNDHLPAPKYALFLFVAVLLNVVIWAVEKVIDVNFELLSISYIVTELLLLLIHGMLCDYGIIRPEIGIVSARDLAQLNTRLSPAGALPPGMADLFQDFAEKSATLSSAERRILNYYIDGYETADIPELAYISIHTVKKHNRSIYQKLHVASRDELMLYIEMFRRCGRLHELTGEVADIIEDT